MKNGYVKLSISKYDDLIIESLTKSRQLLRQEDKLAELQKKLDEKNKVQIEMREYIKVLEEAVKKEGKA